MVSGRDEKQSVSVWEVLCFRILVCDYGALASKPEPVIMVILMIYQKYINKRWWGLSLTEIG